MNTTFACRRTLGAVLLAAPGLGAQAEDPEAAFAEFLRLMRTPIISSSKAPQDPSRAPAKVVVITAKEIRHRGYQDLEEILHDLAGFDFEKGFGVHWSQIYMRGERSTNSDRFLFIWDGVIQNDIWAQVTWFERQFPLSNIDRIEILYGPASLLYGTNAISGIIQVHTRTPEQVNGLEVQLNAGPFRTRTLEVNAGKAIGPWRWMANGKMLQSDERDLNDEAWTDQAGRRRPYGLRFPGDYDLAGLAANGNLDPGTGGLRVQRDGRWIPFKGHFGRPARIWFAEAGVGYRHFDLKAQYWYREQAQEPWYVPQVRIAETWIPTAWNVRASYEWQPRAGLVARSSALMRSTGIDPSTEVLETLRDKDFSPTDPVLPKVTGFKPYKFHKLFSREFRAGQSFRYQKDNFLANVEGEFIATKTYESYNTRTLSAQPWAMTPQHSDRNLSTYANMQGDLTPRIALAAGIRYDYNWEVGGPGGFGHLTTSRAAAIFTPSDGHTIRVISGKAFQAPQPFKKYSTVDIRPVPSPNLKPEEEDSLELAYEWKPRAEWRHTFSVFHSVVSNKIDLVPLPNFPTGSVKFENRGAVEIFGQEWEGRFILRPWDSTLFANLTLNSAKDKTTGRPTGGIAPWKANLGLDFRIRKITGSLRLHAVAKRDTAQWDSGAAYSLPSVPGYVTADLSLSWTGLWPHTDLRLSATNLANTRYFDTGVRSADGAVYPSAILQLPFRLTIGLAYRQ